MLTIVTVKRDTVVIICWCRLECVKFHFSAKVECWRCISLLAEDGINICVRCVAPWFVCKYVWLPFSSVAHYILS